MFVYIVQEASSASFPKPNPHHHVSPRFLCISLWAGLGIAECRSSVLDESLISVIFPLWGVVAGRQGSSCSTVY